MNDTITHTWQTTGPFGWTVGAWMVLLAFGIPAWLVAAGYFWLAPKVPCDEEGRIAFTCALIVATTGACLPVAAIRTPIARALSVVAGALIGGFLGWGAIHLAFAHHFCY